MSFQNNTGITTSPSNTNISPKFRDSKSTITV